MKLSELIEQLQLALNEYGNLNVSCCSNGIYIELIHTICASEKHRVAETVKFIEIE